MSNFQQQQPDKHLDILNRLVEVSLVLNSSLSIYDILPKVMDATAKILDAEQASVILYDQHTKELHFLALSTEGAHSEALVRIPIPLDGSIAGSIFRENTAIVLDDVSTDPRHFRLADDQSGFQTRSLLGVPMRIKNRVVGVLEAVNKKAEKWDNDDQYYLEILASQAAIAMENASLVHRLQKANDELSQVDKLKSDFISIASHELRTPLGVIMGYASFLQEEAQGDLSEHATMVVNSALKMRKLIEDMTNLRFLDIGESELKLEKVTIAELMKLAESDVVENKKSDGHQLTIELPDEDIYLNADRSRLLMAISKLIDNAIKFTSPEDGKILVQCENRPNEIWLTISDNGVGIPETELENIFKPFQQVEDHMTRHYGGMGLGLAISRSVIEVHRGRIWAESDGPSQGARFVVSLPKAAD